MAGQHEKGAIAVEFALLLPLLLMILLGIMEFGRAYNAQITLTQAAREGARVMAIEDDAEMARNATVQAAASLNPSQLTVHIASRDPQTNGPLLPNKCSLGHQVTVRVNYEAKSLTGFFGPTSLRGEGAMLCGG